MAFFKTGCFIITDLFGCKNFNTLSQFLVTHKRRKKKFGINWSINHLSKFFISTIPSSTSNESSSSDLKTTRLCFSSGMINQFFITQEIQYFRNCRNHFVQMSYNDMSEPNGPPLAILLPSTNLSENLLIKFIEIYGDKGFDVLTVNLTTNQMLFPCVAGGAMNVVSNLLEYLNETHRCRPYIFHGFSFGSYVYGEILAQFADQCETYRAIINNVKGCLWDSPVDIMAVKHCIGKYLYPNNWYCRWRFDRDVRNHFKNHQHDSITYWNRSRDNFSNPLVKAPNVFFVSYSDILSNPTSLQIILKTLECNGVPIFQKTWCDSKHIQHFEKYCYEYVYGMVLFFNLCNFFPDDCGKYRYSPMSSSLIAFKEKYRDCYR